MNIEDLYPAVLPNVRGCPHITALGAIQASAIEFCRRTLVWRKTLPQVSSVLDALAFTVPLVAAYSGTLTAPFAGPTRTDYILTFSDGTFQIVTLSNGRTAVAWASPVTATISATYSQVQYAIPATADAIVAKLLKFSLNDEPKRVANPDFAEDVTLYRDQPDIAWTTDRVNFQVSPAPGVAGNKYGLVVALQPTMTALTLPDEIGNTYGEDISFGALWRLQRMNGRQWSSTDDGGRNLADFNRRISIVSGQASKGFGRGARRVRPHHF